MELPLTVAVKSNSAELSLRLKVLAFRVPALTTLENFSPAASVLAPATSTLMPLPAAKEAEPATENLPEPMPTLRVPAAFCW